MSAYPFTRPAVLRTLKESPARKRWRWQRYVYIGLVTGFLLVVGYVYLLKFIYVYGNGYVIVDKVDVSLFEDSKIDNLYVTEGQRIQRGQALFSYGQPGTDAPNITEEVVQTSGGDREERGRIDRERVKAQQDIDAKSYELEALAEQILQTQGEIRRVEAGVRLGINSATQLFELKSQLKNLQIRLAGAYNVMEADKIQLRSLTYTPSGVGVSRRRVERLTAGSTGRLKDFPAPSAGVVTRVYKKPSEIALKGEVLMHLELNHEPYILAYFDQDNLDEIVEGRDVQIKFPNGRKSDGYLKKVYYTTMPVPAEFKENFKAAKRSIAARVAPHNPAEAESWHSLYKMNVVVSLSKF